MGLVLLLEAAPVEEAVSASATALPEIQNGRCRTVNRPLAGVA